jgi:hypothetical protein
LLLLVLFASAASQAQSTAQNVFHNYKDALFQIQIIELASGNKSSIGSGFLINENSQMITNYHVVSDYVHHPAQYKMQYMNAQGEIGNLQLITFDVVNDLAFVVASDNIISSNNFSLADNLPNQGEAIYSLGNPHDLGMIVVPGTFNGLKKTSFYHRIHFTGSINPGMSGGPVVNKTGAVIGVNVATAGNQIGFLVPLIKIKELLEKQTVDQSTEANPFESLIQQQLQANQAQLVTQITQAEWKKGQIGNALIPNKIVDFISCWGDSNASNKQAKYLSVQSRCRLDEQIYVNRGFQTGAVEMEFEWITSKNWKTHKFYNFYSQSTSGAGPGNPAREDDVTNYRCQSDVVTNINEVTSKTSLCLRAYKKYDGLYDVLFVAASLDHENSGLISHFTLSGVDKTSAIGFSQRFMDSIAWQ